MEIDFTDFFLNNYRGNAILQHTNNFLLLVLELLRKLFLEYFKKKKSMKFAQNMPILASQKHLDLNQSDFKDITFCRIYF